MGKLKPQARYFPFGGGLDLVSPAMILKPGALLAAVNYEPWFGGGYRRIDGFERFDGRRSPSDPTIAWLTFQYTGFVGGPVTGDFETVTSSGGGTGIITFNANGYVSITAYSGSWVLGETFLGGGSFAGTITSVPTASDNPVTDDNGNSPEGMARNYYRSLILPMSGVGAARAAWIHPTAVSVGLGPTVIGIRSNGTHDVFYLATSSGWTTAGISGAFTMYFGAGQAAGIAAGDTLTGNSSGATALVDSVILHAGSFSGNDASGYLIFGNTSGTFTNGETIKRGATTVATAAIGSSQFTLPNNGSYQFVNYNFYGGAQTYYTYGVSSKGPAFEIDTTGAGLVRPILFPLSPKDSQPVDNAPFLLEVHQNFLFLASRGGQFYQSVAGTPLQFNGFLAAEQFGAGAEITSMLSTTGPALIISTQHDTQALLGTGPSDWQLGKIGERMGAQLYTGQKLDSVYGFNPVGISKFARTQTFGNFAGATISQLVQPLLNEYQIKATCSRIVRLYNQYRLYFNDGTFLIMFIPEAGQSNMPGVSSAQASNDVAFGFGCYPALKAPAAMYTGVDVNGVEQCYFVNSNDGYVYHDVTGTSFDGVPIPSYQRLAFNNVGSPGYCKFFRRADIELQTSRPFDLNYTADLSFDTSAVSNLLTALNNAPASNPLARAGDSSVVRWDEATVGGGAVLQSMAWDAQNVGVVRAELQGTGENIGLMFYNSSDIVDPFVLQGMTLYYELRRLQR